MQTNPSSIHPAGTVRPLFIDFDAHTDGDEEFKKDLIRLMIDDIWELYNARENGKDAFFKICHKVKAMLEIVNDEALNDAIAELRGVSADNWNALSLQVFDQLCHELVRSLEQEAA